MPPGFLRELHDGAPAMQRLTLLLATIAFVLMAVVDPQVASGSDLALALGSRAVSCTLFMLVFTATFFGDWAKRWARPLSLVFIQLIALEVIVLTYATGGGESSYHEALHIVMFGYALLPFPWRRLDGLFSFLGILACYNVVLIAGGRPGSVTQMLTHNALLGVTMMVCTVFERVLKASKLRDFESRAALAEVNERLTALDTAKTRFFSNISHELRTPLTLIVAPLEALLESSREPLSAGQRERMQLAQRNALRLLRLVDDLLSLTRAEAASLKLHVRELDLGQTVQAFVQDVQELAARKQIKLDVDLPTEASPIEADPTLIERVLLNVFGNAAKFVNYGGKIALAVRREGEGWELAITDDGIGISQENLGRVFDRFYQADSGSTRSHGGTGIGLALVKEIIELHGGRVAAESTLGAGTTIRCWLPVQLPASAEPHVVRTHPASAEPQGLPEWHQAIRNAKSYRLQGIDDATERRVAPRPRPRGDAPTILVVEDNPDMIRFLVALMAYDFNVLSAQNGKDGLRMALERRPDLIISDVMMPEMDGFEMVRRLRQDPEGAKIPLIFLTARGSSNDRIEGHSGGADTYLAKPFRSEELLAAVDALLSRQQRIRDSETTSQDEAVVFMASGMLEQIKRALEPLAAVHRSLAARVQGAGAAADAGEDGRQALARQALALDRLGALVSGLSDLTDAGSRPASGPAVVDDALRSIAASAASDLRPTDLSLHVELQSSALVASSEEELRAIVRPLLVRALHVTPSGRNVFLQALPGRGPHSAHVSIVVRDEGPTLTSGQIERLFFPFGAEASAMSAPPPECDVAHALELARARRIVLARGGSVVVEPEPELGSRITVHLPRHVLAETATEAAA